MVSLSTRNNIMFFKLSDNVMMRSTWGRKELLGNLIVWKKEVEIESQNHIIS